MRTPNHNRPRWFVWDQISDEVRETSMDEALDLLDCGPARRVARDTVNEYDVSTVFLCLDHSYDEGQPLIFETLVRDADGEEKLIRRYSSPQEARDGHLDVVGTIMLGALDAQA